MRIAIFTDTFLPQKNGVVSYLTTLINSLSQRQHQILLVYPRPQHFLKHPQLPSSVLAVATRSMRSGLYPDLRFGLPSPKLLKITRNFHPDVIHIQGPASIGIEGLAIAKATKTPVIGSFHTYFTEPEYLKNVRLNILPATKILRKLTAHFYNQCNLVLTPTSIVSKDIASWGIKTPIITLPYGIDVSKIRKPNLKKRKHLISKHHLQQHVCLFIGRLSVEKNLEESLQVFKLVKNNVETAQFLIVGSGPVEQKLKKLTHELGLKKAVIFTGEMPHSEILTNNVYCTAQLYLTTSNSETFGIAAAEAMAAGLPVIAYSSRGLVETVANGGILINSRNRRKMASTVIEMLTNPDKRKKVSQCAIKQAKKIDIDYIISQHEKIYKSI